MKRKGFTLVELIALIVFFSIFIMVFLLPFFMDSSDSVAVADGFTIEKYKVTLDVNEDNKIDVTENITVNWNELYHHGIYKFTPEWLPYTSKDGKTIKRKSKVLNYEAVGEMYTIDVVKKKPRIKIGSPSKTLPLGDKEYIIEYTYDMGKDPFNGFDELIFHAFGDYWGTAINNAEIEVRMPKNIGDNSINFFTDKYRENNVNDLVDYVIDDNIIKAKYKGNLYNSLTIDIELPDNYLVGGSNNYTNISLIISLLIIGITVFIGITWYKYGKDFEKRSQTIEFYPPDDLNPAEVGYIYGNKNYKNLTIALLVSLAAKGYIKINETEDKKDIEIINFMKIPKIKMYEEIFKSIPKREITVKKLKREDSSLNYDEKTIMKYLFKKGNEKTFSANIDKFLKVRDSLVNNGYIKVLSDNETERLQNHEDDIIKYEEMTKEYKKAVEEYDKAIEKMDKLSEIELKIYEKLFEKEDEVLLSKHKSFYTMFSSVEADLEKNIKDKIKDKEASSKVKYAVIAIFISFILSIISFFVIEDMNPKYGIFYYISFACIFINLLFSIIMKRKTNYGEEIIARIKGFKNFLETSEKENLESLVEKDPKYFYNILPYTYVLGVSKKWIKKFEKIIVPEIDMGNINYYSGSDIFSIADHVYYPTPTHSSSSSSRGCSSCGGGCSSCGGGCSSCGGGGSW